MKQTPLPLPGLRWRGLTLQMFLTVVLPLSALLLAVALGGLHFHQQAMRSLVGERDQRATRTAAQALQEQLKHRAAAIQGIAWRLESAKPQHVLDTSAFLSGDFDAGLAVFTADGELLAALGDAAWWRAMQSAYPEVFSSGQTFSPPLDSPDGIRAVILTMATSPQGLLAVGGFQPDTMAQHVLAGAFAPADQVQISLFDSSGRVLYQSGSQSTQPPDHPGLAEALRGESGVTYVNTEEGEHVVAFSPVPPVGWALVIEEPWEVVSSPWLRTTQFAPLVLVPLLLLALVALWFGARQIVGPLQELESRAAALAWGDYEAVEVPVGGIEEIQRLQRTLMLMAQKVRSAQESLRGYIGAITAGQEEERRRLARELHDDTLQALIALQQRIQLARLKLADDPRAAGPLAELQSLTEATIQDLRRLTRALRPIYLEDLGLVPALEMLVAEMQRPGLTIEFIHKGPERRLKPEVELALYRMAQEALNNVIRHAQARHAQVVITFTPDSVHLEVRDDGRGFQVPDSPAEFAPQGHFGLLGLYERADLIGARLSLQSAPGQGTHLQIVLHDRRTPVST